MKLTHITAHGVLMPKTSLFGQISLIAILGTKGVIFKSWPNLLKLTQISPYSLLMPKTLLFGQISLIAILGTEGVIFKILPNLLKLTHISAHSPNLLNFNYGH